MKAGYIILITAAAAGYIGWRLAIRRWKKRWYQENAPFGEQLGYPACCIQAFCDQPPEILKIAGTTQTDKMRYDAGCIDGEFSGFIPCADHARKIVSGEITLNSLITNRNPEFPPFPDLR